MPNSLLYKIAISQISGIGCINAKKLISTVGSLEAIFKESRKNLLKIAGLSRHIVNNILNDRENALEIAQNELLFIDKYNIKPLFYLDKNYPGRLKYCDDSPVVLYVKGKVDFDNQKVISIVGTRNATKYGKDITEKLVKELAEREHEVIIVSGLAYGIDIAAHKSALKYGLKTIAVLAHGLNTIYPSIHKGCAKDIISQGALVTEFISNTGPERPNFVKRNRIIAGLADATIIIESGEKGGALTTADIANSYNRDVFAIPGKLSDNYSAGCNRMIKTNKAALLENIDDLEYLLGWEKAIKKNIQRKIFVELSGEEKIIFDILKGENEISIDVICAKAGLPVSKVSPVLLNLEFNGLVRSCPGNIYKII